MKTFTIITINYNNCEGLKKTIESIKSQSYKDFEYIVIDGGSTDGSVNIINEHIDLIDFSVSESDKGIYNAMNKGLIHATGKWLCFMNSGDCFAEKNTLEKIKSFSSIQNDNIYCMYGNWSTYNNGKIELYEADPFFNYKKGLMWHLWGINHQAIFIRTFIAKHYKFDEKFQICADVDMITKIFKYKGKHTFVHIPITIAVIEPNGYSGKMKKLTFKEAAIILGIFNQKFYYYWCYFKKFYYFRLEWAVKSRLKKIFYSNKYDT